MSAVPHSEESSREQSIFVGRTGVSAFFFAREGAKKTKAKNGGLSCRCAAIHAAGRKARGRGGLACPPFLSHAKARRPSSSGRTLACGSWAGAGVVGAGTLRRLLGLCGGEGDAGGADGAGGGAADADSEASFLGDDLWPDGAFGGAADHDGVLKGEAVGF